LIKVCLLFHNVLVGFYELGFRPMHLTQWCINLGKRGVMAQCIYYISVVQLGFTCRSFHKNMKSNMPLSSKTTDSQDLK